MSISPHSFYIHLLRHVWFQIECETVTEGEKDTLKPWKFKVSYDKLVFGCGAEASTFGIRGVTEHATFLREVHDAQEIRRKLLLNLMLSDVPGMVTAQYVSNHPLLAQSRQLLLSHFVVLHIMFFLLKSSGYSCVYFLFDEFWINLCHLAYASFTVLFNR
ncbi:unnamed protein product [Triticum turgidum subsp. durum]|uniref:Uncharacterized protein n=1 Tax=Triticum turgidum subsp. durum TaxID=4567 RepID=A0A9R0RSS3_TRITD|nr:unnamed protein product [Triticum turgidum subsp. durum]